MDHASTPDGRPARWPSSIWSAILLAGLLWASWPTLAGLAARWAHDPRYSHGFLVPAFSLYLLWARRSMIEVAGWRPSWWGVAWIVAGSGLGLAGARYYLNWIEAMALLPSLAGIALIAGGRTALRWSWPAIAFLIFSIPLPYRLEWALGSPLQSLATHASTYALQTLGMPAVSEGNIILLGEKRIGVVEACNGLGMAYMFAAVAVATVLILQVGPFDKAAILLSSVPIALFANVTRITTTGVLCVKVGGDVADAVYHDLAGWLMMPLALGAIWVETTLLSWLLLDPEPARPFAFGLGGTFDPLRPGMGSGDRNRPGAPVACSRAARLPGRTVE